VQAEGVVGVAGGGERLHTQEEFADERVVVVLGAMGAAHPVVVGPPAAEVLVPQGQLADQLGQLGVGAMGPRVQVQGGHGVAGDRLPVGVQLAGGLIEKDEPGQVAFPVRQRVEVGEQRAGHPVGGQHVQAAAGDHGQGGRVASHEGGSARPPVRAAPSRAPAGAVRWFAGGAARPAGRRPGRRGTSRKGEGRMRRRTLGGTGMSVSEFALGTMMFGATGNPDHDESIRMIHPALDAGRGSPKRPGWSCRTRLSRSSGRTRPSRPC
jgi:hypothetical protein